MVQRPEHSMTAEVESALGPAPASYAQPEVSVLRFRRHGHRLVLPSLVLIVTAWAAGFWIGTLPETWMNIAAAVGAVAIAVLFGVLPVLMWLAHRTTVTSRRVIVRKGLLASTRSELALARVREVRLRRGPLQRLRGSGTIELLHGAEALRLQDVPGAAGVADALHDLMERNFEHATRMQQRISEVPSFVQGATGQQRSNPDNGQPVTFW